MPYKQEVKRPEWRTFTCRMHLVGQMGGSVLSHQAATQSLMAAAVSSGLKHCLNLPNVHLLTNILVHFSFDCTSLHQQTLGCFQPPKVKPVLRPLPVLDHMWSSCSRHVTCSGQPWARCLEDGRPSLAVERPGLGWDTRALHDQARP